ncbi:MAG: ubiquinone biosynthesis regulatory protein kinase UbiB, partial [Thiomicrospira sp.]|nr:ubiquinone biosynthesis regulatory protein kinase UbiB [Thiomicrospira sp.]
MNPFKQLFRLIKINRVITYYRLDQMVLANSKYRSLIWLNRLLPWNWRSTYQGGRGVCLRLALE